MNFLTLSLSEPHPTMSNQGWSPREQHCISLLKRTNNPLSLFQIHAHMLRNGLETNLSLLTKFIAALSEASGFRHPLDGIRHAQKAFDCRLSQDPFLCNSMIRAHTLHNQFHESFSLYKTLNRQKTFGFRPDCYTFPFLVKSCATNSAIDEGKQLHTHVFKLGFRFDLFASTAMVDMYSKFGNLIEAQRLFEDMRERSLVSWTTIVAAFARAGDMAMAENLFRAMPDKDLIAYNAMIDGYVKAMDMTSAKEVFDEMPERNVVSWTTMITGYCKAGALDRARVLFDQMPEKNSVSWSAMISGYRQNREPSLAIELFREFQVSSTLDPDANMVRSLVPAIADVGALRLGKWVHAYARRMGFTHDVRLCTTLVDMYAKCGDIDEARRVFDEMVNRETGTWNALIGGLAVNGRGREALIVFSEMREKGVRPNAATMVVVLRACGHAGLVEEGKRIFEGMLKVVRERKEGEVVLGEVVRGGAEREDDGKRKLREKVKLGHEREDMCSGERASEGVRQSKGIYGEMMRGDDERHGRIILIAKEGKMNFRERISGYDERENFGVAPEIEHYGCMIDLLGRAGFLDEAEELIERMPFEGNDVVWSSLLFACRCYGDVKRAERVVGRLGREGWSVADWVGLRNAYAGEGRWGDVEGMRGLMIEKEERKSVGCSVIEVDERVWEFLACDRRHPDWKEIYGMLGQLGKHITEGG
ncbi:pentatricopeptide repeat-containing protein At2g44880 [Amborella trichopoda]|uniref:pentatricopeptide repeat-containing protein At2g44880 n=1 Tax=Amborella trichopoda TaxID=13333 RepID=UPI0009BD90AA|nr:pentatricopeptide repeat-containing protein At2g44880 [Amborella trichopoda]|eukprot:XP_020519253.1 pentatricopeptide repeat-containing protein At2g44880 [Amborella trichopoda]